jgi:membrane-associated phospholipid phosphatase
VFEVATVAAHHTRSVPLRILYYAVATSISLQRVDSRAHWPSDIFMGAVVGTAVARAIVRRHAEAKRAPATAPAAPPPASVPASTSTTTEPSERP